MHYLLRPVSPARLTYFSVFIVKSDVRQPAITECGKKLQQHNFFKKYAAGQVFRGKRCRQVGSYVVLGPRATNCFQFRLVRCVSFSELWSLFFLILLNVFKQETVSLAHRHWEVQTFQLLLYEKYNNLFCWDARRVCAFVLGFTKLWLVRQHHLFIVCLGNAIG